MLISPLRDEQEPLSERLARIGNTPLKTVNLDFLRPNYSGPRALYLKLEGFNPGGSVKDRTALALIRDLESKGALLPGGTIVESTSGNLGVAMAYICATLGYKFIAVVDPKTTPENLAKITDAGASVAMVTEADEAGGYLLSRLKKVRELISLVPDSVWPNQYENPANVQAHYYSTGPEIALQMSGKIDVAFLSVSTGGTLAGVSRYLRSKMPEIRIFAVDAEGSVALGGQPGSRLLTGMGASRRSSFVETSDYNDVVYVNDVDAFSCCRALWKATGIRVGGSSGAVIAAALTRLPDFEGHSRIVCLCPDTGDNYSSSIFNDLSPIQRLPGLVEREEYYQPIFTH